MIGLFWKSIRDRFVLLFCSSSSACAARIMIAQALWTLRHFSFDCLETVKHKLSSCDRRFVKMRRSSSMCLPFSCLLLTILITINACGAFQILTLHVASPISESYGVAVWTPFTSLIRYFYWLTCKQQGAVPIWRRIL